MAINSPTPLQITIRPLLEQQSAASNTAAATAKASFWSEETPTFKDILDIVNPLQHLPIISNLYRSITGDIPSSASSIIGSTLLSGPIGLFTAIANEVVKTETGNDIGGNILSKLLGNTNEIDVVQAPTYSPPPTNLAAYNAYRHAQNTMG